MASSGVPRPRPAFDPMGLDWKGLWEEPKMPQIGPQFSMLVKLAYLENEMARFQLAMEPIARVCKKPAAHDDDVLRVAYRRRLTHTAPPEWQPHLPMVGFLPPAPQPEVMRAGVLGQYGQDPRMMDLIPTATKDDDDNAAAGDDVAPSS